MPWEPTGKKPGKQAHGHFKLAAILMYGMGIPGVKALGKGRLYCQMAPLIQHTRMTGVMIKKHLTRLQNIGIIDELEMNRGNFLVRIKQPGIWNER